MRLFLPLLFLPAFSFLSAQYASPLTVPLRVTGTFGELRSDHFHAGIDFRAEPGSPVLAVAAGYVSRVVVTGGGYGQAVYVDHPDGHRTVYGHLNDFFPALSDTVRRHQYVREAFRVSLRFDSLAFPVAAGDLLGTIGNRGYSFGPHLHFEVRESATDVALNPLAFGFPVEDTRRPQLRMLRFYELEEDFREVRTHTVPVTGDRLADTVFVTTPRVGIGLKAYDRQNALPNWNGVYATELYQDSTLLFANRFDRIPFEETEYLNALTDFADWKNNTSWFYRLWLLPGMQAAWRKDAVFDGTLVLQPNLPLELRVVTSDYAGNRREVSVTLALATPPVPATPPKHHYFLPQNEASIIDNGDLRLELPAGALYRDLYLHYGRLPDDSEGRLSDTYRLHRNDEPLHGTARLALRPGRPVADSLKSKVFLARCGSDGQLSRRRGEWTEDGRFAANISEFGDYALFIDTVPPVVKPARGVLNVPDLAFSLEVDDPAGGGPGEYRATVNGAWALLEYDAKSGRLFHRRDAFSPLRKGENELELRLFDRLGNLRIFRQRLLFRR